MSSGKQGSIAAKIDPAAKIIWLLVISIAGSMFLDAHKLLPVTGVVVFPFLLCRKENLIVAWRYKYLIFFVPSLLFIYHIGIIPSLSGNLLNFSNVKWDSASYSIKILNSVLALTFLLSTTDIRQLVNRLASLGLPLKAAFAIYLTLRFVEILRVDAASIREALKLHRKTRWLQVTRYPATLVFLGLHRANQTASAMDLRGFSSGIQRTYFGSKKWSPTGWLLPIVSGVAIIASALTP
jgi:energy-coupling factor transporter transmembrane protein EcfT